MEDIKIDHIKVLHSLQEFLKNTYHKILLEFKIRCENQKFKKEILLKNLKRNYLTSP